MSSPVCALCSAISVVINMLAPASSTKEAAICVTAKTRWRRLVLPVIRTLPLDKHYDPRARIIKRVAYEVFDLMGKNPLLEIALECERIALEDDYFVKRKLYPNVDFYTGLIYQSMGFPMTMFPVLFAIPRTSGWIAQWEELLLDAEQKIARPRQIYLGHDTRHYVPIDERT